MTQPFTAALKVEAVAPSKLAPNPYNPNHMEDEQLERLCQSISKLGFVDPILVRVHPKKLKREETPYQIIDGEHRWRAATKLGMATVQVINLGKVKDHVAKTLTLQANTRGEDDPDKVVALVRELSAVAADLPDGEELPLPWSSDELEAMLQSSPVDEDDIDYDEESEPAEKTPKANDPTVEGVPKVAVLNIHVPVKAWNKKGKAAVASFEKRIEAMGGHLFHEDLTVEMT